MQYTQFDNIQLSQLGMGAMRLPQMEPGFAKPIDEPKAMELIDYCMAHGVNYFDTATSTTWDSPRCFWGRR